jgi:hypothetical protein
MLFSSGRIRHRAFPPRDHHTRQRGHSRRGNGVAQHHIHVLARIAIRHHVIAGIKVDRMDRVARDELAHSHGGRSLDTGLLEVLVIEQDIALLLEFVAPDELRAWHFLVRLGIQCDRPHAVTGLWIDEVKVQIAARTQHAVQRYGAAHQSEPQMSPPDRSLRHFVASQRSNLGSPRDDCQSAQAHTFFCGRTERNQPRGETVRFVSQRETLNHG